MIRGYLTFLDLLTDISEQLKQQNITKPDCSLSNTGVWRPSEIEMALFCWAGDI